MSDLAAKVRDLNAKLEDIRREQQYQREREADYRDLSEQTNSRAVWYSVAQIGVLVGTCAWQLRQLKVRCVFVCCVWAMPDLTCFCRGFLRIGRCGSLGMRLCTGLHAMHLL